MSWKKNPIASLFNDRGHMKSIHVKHLKTTEDKETRQIKVPSMVYISMAQHIGVPAKPLVKPGDQVFLGQLIGDSDAFVSAPIHSSVSGTVDKIEKIRSASGGHDTLVAIKPDRKQTPWEGIALPAVTNYEEFVQEIRKSGLVGLGGAVVAPDRNNDIQLADLLGQLALLQAAHDVDRVMVVHLLVVVAVEEAVHIVVA